MKLITNLKEFKVGDQVLVKSIYPDPAFLGTVKTSDEYSVGFDVDTTILSYFAGNNHFYLMSSAKEVQLSILDKGNKFIACCPEIQPAECELIDVEPVFYMFGMGSSIYHIKTPEKLIKCTLEDLIDWKYQFWIEEALGTTCPDCKGTGKYISALFIDPCRKCGGKGKI